MCIHDIYDTQQVEEGTFVQQHTYTYTRDLQSAVVTSTAGYCPPATTRRNDTPQRHAARQKDKREREKKTERLTVSSSH